METKYLFQKRTQKQFWKKINKKNEYILFLDYDGTLAKFKDNPANALPYPGIPEIISKIDNNNKINICIISGRPVRQLKDFIDLSDIYYAGLHGLQIDEFKAVPVNITENFKKLKNKLKAKKGDYPIQLEDKEFVLTIHYPSNFKRKNELTDLISNYKTDKYEVISGRNNLEIRPQGWNKGDAVNLLTQKLTQNKALPIYIGDDTTDEDAFKVLKGITIYVKNNDNLKTNAEYYIKDPEEVYLFLKKFYNKVLS